MLDHLARLKGIVPGRDRRELVQALLRKTNLFDVRRQCLGTYSGGTSSGLVLPRRCR